MDWVRSISKTIEIIEEHLTDEDDSFDIGKEVGISSVYLQKSFSFMTGFTIAEYSRNRRLYLAAMDYLADVEKLTDIAFKYGFTTYESFVKAFSRFHGCTPTALKKDPSKLKIFLPLKISITITGADTMQYAIEDFAAKKFIGFVREFNFDNMYYEIPLFWNEIINKYMSKVMCHPENAFDDISKAVAVCNIGKYGICIDEKGSKSFKYMIAGDYNGEVIPQGLEIFDCPQMEVAKFDCTGPLPGAMQAVYHKIFNEWLPSSDYELSHGINIEWYDNANPSSIDYKSAIYVPVKKQA